MPARVEASDQLASEPESGDELRPSVTAFGSADSAAASYSFNRLYRGFKLILSMPDARALLPSQAFSVAWIRRRSPSPIDIPGTTPRAPPAGASDEPWVSEATATAPIASCSRSI